MIRRILYGLLSGLVLLLAIGWTYESVGQARLERRFAAPGELVDVGGRNLHVHCLGVGDPTVVVEAGSGSWSNDWLPAQRLLAERQRVCTYDRPGYGWSDPADEPATARRLTRDLRRALDGVGVDRPFVLVGHSLGGLYARAYALQHPQDVAGLVLVDARHEDAAEALPEEIVQREREMGRVYGLARVLARFGVVRALGPLLLPPTGLPLAEAEVFWAQATRPRFFRTVQSELHALEQVEARVRGGRHDVPLVVVAHGLPGMFGELPEAEAAERAWQRLQEDLLTRSERSRHIVAHDSGHNVPIERPAVVVDAVRALEAVIAPER